MNIWITGASSGIGEALVMAYAKRYQTQQPVFGLLARRANKLQAMQQLLQDKYQIKSEIYSVDVQSQALVNVAANHFIQHYGAPHIVIACAGVSRGTLTEYSEDAEAFQTIFNINVMGLVYTFMPFIDAMRASAALGNQAQLVGIASVAGIRGLPGAGAYSASKAAAINYLESLRVEMTKYNIAVTTIAPGYIRTPMTDINHYPMPFLMEVANAAEHFLLAIENKARFIVIPWQMGWVTKIMRLIPAWMWDKIMRNAPHKPRVQTSE